MKSILLFTALALVVFSAYGETEVSFALSATTGDKDFDIALSSINVEAQRSLPSFYSSMSLNFGTGQGEIDVLLRRHRLSPADAYLAIRLSVLIGRPIDYVIVRYHKHRKRGWGYVAKRLGIKPGSERFLLLKTGGYVVLDGARKARPPAEVKVKAADRGRHDGRHKKHKSRGGPGSGKGREK
ncbi:MAG: hypothetical protein JXA71_16960 [Chitinispirillaceae bacterium]|nr:hypothetical protein [Chitinispirillaceae bacterium]